MMFTRSAAAALALLAGLATALPAPANETSPAVVEKRGNWGTATYYNAETGNQGACGSWLSNNGYTVAMNTGQFQGNCWRGIVIRNPDTNVQQWAQVVDMCPGCGWNSIDLTPSLFQALVPAGLGQGVQTVDWWWA